MTTERMGIYKCEQCGKIVEVLHEGDGTLVCCGEPMKRTLENTVDAAVEKHVPVVEAIDGGFKVTVGQVPHPMVEDHWIEWIELTAGAKTYRAFLDPGDAPEASFLVEADSPQARAYCNQHGLWKG